MVSEQLKRKAKVIQAWKEAKAEFIGFAAYRPNGSAEDHPGIPSSLKRLVKSQEAGLPYKVTPFESYSLVMSKIEHIGDANLIVAARLAVATDNCFPYTLEANAGIAQNLEKLILMVAKESKRNV